MAVSTVASSMRSVMNQLASGVATAAVFSVATAAPNAQLAIFPGADHFLLFTSPDKVLGTLVPFLDAPASETTK
jgi:pimeloyl-ACP methyl ester carboxylesterase